MFLSKIFNEFKSKVSNKKISHIKFNNYPYSYNLLDNTLELEIKLNNFKNIRNHMKLSSNFELWKIITLKRTKINLEVKKLNNLLTSLDNYYKNNSNNLTIITDINQYKIDKNKLSYYFDKWINYIDNSENNTGILYSVSKKYMRMWLNNHRKYKKLRNKNNMIRREIKKIIYNLNLINNVFSYWKYKTRTQSFYMWCKYN